ncbi:MAG: glycosyl hydrolase family 28-related protein [Chthoniobacteraceae bacterium]
MKTLRLTLSLILAFTLHGSLAKANRLPITTVTDPRDGSDELVAVCKVQDFGAKADGETDDTEAFKQAIQYASDIGGGTVYAPAGKYAIKGTLMIPKSVYLAGEWFNPETNPEKISQGTVLYAYEGKGNAEDTSFIILQGSTGVIGITVYYPEQNITNPIPYPWAIQMCDKYDGKTTGYSTVQNVTLVNPYRGVLAGPKGCQLQVIDGLYGSPIYEGISILESWDVPKVQKVSLGASYWMAYDKDKPNVNRIVDTMKAHLTGFTFGHDTWNFIYDLSIADCKVGLFFNTYYIKPKCMSYGDGQMDLVTIKNAVTGIAGVHGYGGIAMARTHISTDGSPGSACVRLQPPFDSTIHFIDSTFSNPGGSCVVVEKGVPGVFAAQNSTFKKWGNKSNAIQLMGGSLTVTYNTFTGPGTAITIADSALGAVIDKNTYARSVKTPVVSKRRDNSIHINTHQKFASLPNPNYEVDLGIPPTVPHKKLVSVTDFGAIADGSTDCTEAFSKALKSAAEAGGGIVYIPGGMYLLNGTLVVPSKVELRGVSEAGHHTSGCGSMLLTTQGADNANGAPFISLEQGSILRGLTIWYPEQDYENIHPYPWAIRGLGKDISIRYVVVGNGYQALDLGTYDCGGHYVDALSGMTFSKGLWLDNSSTRGVLKNVHFNPHFIVSSKGTKLPAGADFNKLGAALPKTVFNAQDKYNTAFIIGKTTNETVFSIFNYRSNVGLKLTGGFNGILHGLGLDGTVVDMCVMGQQTDPIVIVNTIFDIVPGASEYGNGHFFTETTNPAKIDILNSRFTAWNFVPKDELANKNAILNLKSNYFATSSNSGAVVAYSGTTHLQGCIFGHLGKLDPATGIYSDQDPSAIDILAHPEATVSAHGNLGKGSFNATGMDNNKLEGNVSVPKMPAN